MENSCRFEILCVLGTGLGCDYYLGEFCGCVFFRCVPLAQAYFTLRMQQEMLSIEREYVVLCHGIPGYDLATSNSSHETIGLLEFCFLHGREDQERIEGQLFEQPWGSQASHESSDSQRFFVENCILWYSLCWWLCNFVPVVARCWKTRCDFAVLWWVQCCNGRSRRQLELFLAAAGCLQMVLHLWLKYSSLSLCLLRCKMWRVHHMTGLPAESHVLPCAWLQGRTGILILLFRLVYIYIYTCIYIYTPTDSIVLWCFMSVESLGPHGTAFTLALVLSLASERSQWCGEIWSQPCRLAKSFAAFFSPNLTLTYRLSATRNHLRRVLLSEGLEFKSAQETFVTRSCPSNWHQLAN